MQRNNEIIEQVKQQIQPAYIGMDLFRDFVYAFLLNVLEDEMDSTIT